MKKLELRDVLRVQSVSGDEWRMMAFITNELKRIGVSYTTDVMGNIYATKGKAKNYPCAVSHMDTVHAICDNFELIEFGDSISGFDAANMKPHGIGGDDKVGVYCALRLLADLSFCKAAFFVSEEIGCVGSASADLDFFNNCRFVLQADRKGNKDFITNASGVELSSKGFQKAIKNIIKGFGYSFASGLMTDVMQLKEDGLNVCAANISCGYHRPHTNDEYCSIVDVEKCYEMMNTICRTCTQVYNHKAPARSYTYSQYNYQGYANMGASNASIGASYKSNWDGKYTQSAEWWNECECCNSKKPTGWSAQWHMWICDTCKELYK